MEYQKIIIQKIRDKMIQKKLQMRMTKKYLKKLSAGKQQKIIYNLIFNIIV